MHKLFKKFFAVCCSLVMISVLSSCNGDGQKSTNPDQHNVKNDLTVTVLPSKNIDNPIIRLNFNRPVNPETININSFSIEATLNHDTINIDKIECSNDNTVVAVSLKNPSYNTEYEIIVRQSVTDMNGSHLAEDYTSQFQFEGLKVVSVYPALDEKIAKKNTPIEFKITFNKDVDSTTFNKDTFKVTIANSKVFDAKLKDFSCSGTVCTVKSTYQLCITTYKIEITNQLKSTQTTDDFLTDGFTSTFEVSDGLQ